MNGGVREPAAISYVFWEEDGAWIGYFEEFPDYWTQGASREDLEEHLRDLNKDLSHRVRSPTCGGWRTCK